jgi:hypothetical protein
MLGSSAIVLGALVAGAVPHLRATHVEKGPVVDGVLDDAVWKQAEASSAYTQKQPHDGSPPSEPTTVRVVYDDDAIYVAFDCVQTKTPMAPRLTRRDRQTETDIVGFDLGTRHDGKSAFEFYVSVSGVLIDTVRFNDTDFSSDWDENWTAKTAVNAHGWTAEFRIPLRILRFSSAAVQSWDFQSRRYISNAQEIEEWAYHPRTMGGEVSLYGLLDDLRDLRPRTPIELRPFLVGRIRRRDPATTQLASGFDATASGGLDFVWHPTQALTLDGTFNPDFAQVEADQVVLNLTTFETYYPEKRPFFLEGIETFSTPFQLLYTRRIGRVPSIPTLRTDSVNNEQLVDVPDPTPIYGAVKLAGQLGDKWSVGTLQAVTAQNDVQVQLGNGQRVNRLIDPTSGYGVVRLRRDITDKSYIAFMGTAVTRGESVGYPLLPPPGRTELCPDGTARNLSSRCFNDAFVGGFDGRWRSSDGVYSAGGQAITSSLTRGPSRAVADGTVIQPGDLGYGAAAFANKDGGEHWVGSVNGNVQTAKLDFNDVGYNRRANQYTGWGTLEYREMVPFGPFLETHVFPNGGSSANIAGLNLGSSFYLASWGKFKNFWGYYADFHVQSDRYDDREVGDGTALERAPRYGNEMNFWTDSTKALSFGFDQITEVLPNGLAMNGSARATLRVLPQLDADLLPTWVYAYGEPRFTGLTTTTPYIFGKQDAKSIGLTLRSTYTFAPTLTLQAYAQLFLASGHYTDLTTFTGPAGSTVHLSDLVPYVGPPASNPDFEQGALNVNVVLRWEYMLGSTLFLVYTRAQVPATTLGMMQVGDLDLGAVKRAPAADAVLLKLTYWWAG